jgi:hypothetical protein
MGNYQFSALSFANTHDMPALARKRLKGSPSARSMAALKTRSVAMEPVWVADRRSVQHGEQASGRVEILNVFSDVVGQKRRRHRPRFYLSDERWQALPQSVTLRYRPNSRT